MKLLIKLNFENDYNLFEILDTFYDNISDKENTFFILNINKELIIDEEKLNNYYNLKYYKESIYPFNEFINSNIDNIEWDILLTSNKIFKPIKRGFDKFVIKNSVKDVMWWKDNKRKESSIFSINKDYYKKFNYIINPIYKSFDYSIKEFKEISSLLKNNLYMIYNPIFELIDFNEDEFIYERRKKFNFTLEEDEIKKTNHEKINKYLLEDENINKTKTNENKNNIKSDYELLKYYLKTGIEFLIYKDNKIIYRSKNNKENIKIHPNYFETYGRRHKYMGIQIKFK